jgi:hypothetical protein
VVTRQTLFVTIVIFGRDGKAQSASPYYYKIKLVYLEKDKYKILYDSILKTYVVMNKY